MYTTNSNDITSAAECDDSSMLVLRNWGEGCLSHSVLSYRLPLATSYTTTQKNITFHIFHHQIYLLNFFLDMLHNAM